MDVDNTHRFSGKAEVYARFRPGYPVAILQHLQVHRGFSPRSVVADVGAGTGKLTEIFLRNGNAVFAVEPNGDMREEAERTFSSDPRVHSVDGTAEATRLATASVDLIAAGQAFHWFDPDRSKVEFRRILRPGGWVVLAWNERLVEGKFLADYEALLHRYGPDYARIDHRQMDAAVMDDFFGAGNWRQASFPNQQRFDLTGLLGRLHSSSYAPPAGSEAYSRINEEISRLFAECQQDGLVAFRYETKVYYGRLS